MDPFSPENLDALNSIFGRGKIVSPDNYKPTIISVDPEMIKKAQQLTKDTP